MPVRYISIGDAQQPLTLNMLIQAPTVIAERFLSVMANQFVMERVLRNAGPAPGGAVQFRVSSGIFADQSSEIVNERAEIPLATITKGDLKTQPTRPHAMGVSVSYEMMEMDVTGEVNRQLGVVRNTMVRDIDGVFLAQLQGAGIQTVAAAFPWANVSATIRKNINSARLLIATAQAPGAVSGAYLGYRADTLLINPSTEADLLNSTEFIQMVFGQVQPSYALSSLADVPGGQVLGLRPLVSTSVPAGTAYVLESNTVGGYADRVPLGMTELYDWPPARIHRADAYRDTTAFVDQPLSAVSITGI